MCGRYTLRASRKHLAEAFDAAPCAGVPDLFERYNLAPQQEAPIVRQGHEGRVVDMARWGLVPAWVKSPAQLQSAPINARADRAAVSPMFKDAMRRRRCLVPATGFYEWQARGARQPKQPYYLHPRDGGLIAFAGLWERWEDQSGEPLDTFTILTTDPNDLVKPIHDRMPVILPPDAWQTWLDPALQASDQLAHLLKPPPADDWAAVPVSRHVNKPAHDDPGCIEPVDESADTQAPPERAQRRLY